MSIIQHVDKLIQGGSEFSEQNIREYFHDLGLDQKNFDMTPRA